MKRMTNEEVRVDESVDGMIGPLVDLTNMKPKLLDRILNGPTLNGVSKDTLRSIIRQLYSALAACEDTGLEPEEVDKLTKDWSDLCTVLGECGGIDALRELAEADKDGRLVVLPRKTRQTELLKMFPEAHVSANGSLCLCPASVSAAYRDENGICKVRRLKCTDCCKEFWGQEVE